MRVFVFVLSISNTTGIVARNFRGRGSGPADGRPRMAITADFAKGSSGAGIFNTRDPR